MTKKKKDSCEFCLGGKGGAPGNEIVINGVIACKDCATLLIKAMKSHSVLMPAQIAKVQLKAKGQQKAKQLGQLGQQAKQLPVITGEDFLVSVKDGF